MSKILEYAPAEFAHLEYVCGLDEVGRGCFAGPVVTAAVIFPKDFRSSNIRDSKFYKTDNQRKKAYDEVIANCTAYAVDAVPATTINEIGINPSTFLSMRNCLDHYHIPIEHLLIDGTVWDPYKDIPYSCVPKGDDTYISIAAASIIAKVRRDEYMKKVSGLYPDYNFAGNKGYYCSKHGEALLKNGMTRYHRHQYVETWLKKQ